MKKNDTMVVVFVLLAIIALAFVFTNLCIGCAAAGVAGVTTQKLEVKNISVQAAYEMINRNATSDDFVILDIRTPEEFAQGHLADAINIDYYSPDFKENLEKLDRNKTYLVYCRTAHRSGLAMPIFEELGFEDVYNVLGGINAWKAAGYPTE